MFRVERSGKGDSIMPEIRPVSDLQTHLSDISKYVHESGEPLYLTENGYGDMVVMSAAAFDNKLFEMELYYKIREAEIEAAATDVRYTHEEVFEMIDQIISEGGVERDV
jgi:PHD/YefM family antitoxin component YafN of YafNO toxin-antitoxin module